MRQLGNLALLAMVWGAAPVWADEPAQAQMKTDVVLRALVDELERNHAELTLEDLARPYFIEYGLTDSNRCAVVAELGAVTSRADSRSRVLMTDVRVGSYELDNSNFQGGGYGGRRGMSDADLPLEDDYQAIRQAIWWATDRNYKDVVETLVQKQAFMESKLIEDKPDDFTRETPAVYFEDRIDLALETAGFADLAAELSAVFREFPEVQSSGVSINAYAGNRYLVNTEGSRLRTAGQRFSIAVNATVQADDGMKLADAFTVYGRAAGELPPRAELLARCRQMATQLSALRSAPVLDSYTGPVLFDAEAAASIFARLFSAAFAGGQRPIGSRTNPDDFANMLNKRILPRFLHVVDNPALQQLAGMPVMGHYVYDDQAVKAQAVTLVEGGRLKALLMSRNPSKEFKQSNGHGRGTYGARAGIGCLVVSAQPPTDAPDLRQELLDACAEEGLEFGIRIASLSSAVDEALPRGMRGRGVDVAELMARRSAGITPLAIYKVYPDGREELVRGAEIARIDLKAFKRMLAAGDKPFVLNSASGGAYQTVAAPALLFEELDLAKIDRDFDKPPILPAPLARQP